MKESRSSEAITDLSKSSFVPNLCQINALFFLLIMTQLLAIVIALVDSDTSLIQWDFLGLISVFCHSIVLTCAAVICQIRELAHKLSLTFTATLYISIIQGVTASYCLTFSLLLPDGLTGEFSNFVSKSLIISLILGGLLLRYFYLLHQWQIQKQAELRARLEALQARIRPHFLFNSMNTIASLIAIDPAKAEDAVLDLSSLFRATLNNQTMLIPVEEELALCRRYLNIEGLRLGERLNIDWQLSEEINRVKIPPLTLQPLLENAIYHGIQPKVEGGTISIEGYCKKETAYILISNPFEPNQSEHEGNRIALENIRSRLAAIFGHRALIKISQLDGTFTVTLRFPTKV